MHANYSKYSLNQILSETDYTQKKTKIICTIGPSCWEVDTLVKMLDAGMNVARLNFSHGDHEGHGETVKKLREAFKQRKHLPCAIMLDTKGPEIRTGLLKDKQAVQIKKGQILELTTDYDHIGDVNKIACSYKGLPKSVKVGGQILIADGQLVGIVKEILDNGVKIECLNDCKLGEKKNMNLPGCLIDLPTVTDKDEDDIVNFGRKYGIDLIALSFTRKAEDVEYVRDLLGPKGRHVGIICKIENQEGMHNYEDILKVADGIMVARGDLGMEIPPQKVFQAQKWMIRRAVEVGKPVVTATQMMESMINNPRPTRAEASDVANAVLDGTDCVMLSGETANGTFPVQCVETMAKIVKEAEMCFDNYNTFWARMQQQNKITKQESVATSAVKISLDLNIPIIVVFTSDGDIIRQVSKYRPKATIVAVSDKPGTIMNLTVSFGVKTLRVPSFQGIEGLIDYAISASKDMNLCKTGDQAVVIMGSTEENPDEGDIMKIKTVA